MNETRKNQVIELLRSTGRPGIEGVIDYMEKSDFFTAIGGHSHHLYEGGLLDHSWEVYECMTHNILLRLTPRDSMIICGLLHDLGKAKSTVEGLRLGRGHDKRSLAILRHFGVPLSKDEEIAILHHQHSLSNYLRPLRQGVSLGDCHSTGGWKNANPDWRQTKEQLKRAGRKRTAHK